MSAPRKSLAALEASGTLQKNRGRYQLRVEAASPSAVKSIGRAPAHFDRDQKSIWREVCRIAPEGTLTVADRISLEMLVRIVHKVRFGTPTMGEANNVQKLLGKFFMNPFDRQRADLAPQQSKAQKAADAAVFDELSELD
jgi:hypothetical protein